ncbi:MAG: HK97 gp10 family phage protein [Pseudobutyrivibrio sp.]|nr:HK97 gp10 family phage protein [Pseudobutyrivibrio sp.]
MPIKFVQHGDFSKTEKFFERCKNLFRLGVLDKYGREGVAALSMATPVDTGKTASSWRYKITSTKTSISIEWLNDSATKDGIPIVVLIQYGHGTGNGGYVQGRDFINPAIQPIFDKITDALWKEVTK